MSTLDIVIVSLAGLQVLALTLMAVTGYLAYRTGMRTYGAAKPALDRASAIAGTGKALADRVRTDGLARVKKVQAVAAAVKKRVQTTVRIARELKPGAQATVEEAKRQRAPLENTTHRVGAIARGLARIRTAAERAREAGKRD